MTSNTNELFSSNRSGLETGSTSKAILVTTSSHQTEVD